MQSVEFDGRLVFIADDGTHGYELWVSDGTAGGTRRLGDLNPEGDSSPLFFTAAGFSSSSFLRLIARFLRSSWVNVPGPPPQPGSKSWHNINKPMYTYFMLDLPERIPEADGKLIVNQFVINDC